LVTGRITSIHSIRLSTMPLTTNTALVEVMNTLNAACARSSGTRVGTEMICAPITSLSVQPKPLAGP
jgi:pheromone shutdown protein TraB